MIANLDSPDRLSSPAGPSRPRLDRSPHTTPLFSMFPGFLSPDHNHDHDNDRDGDEPGTSTSTRESSDSPSYSSGSSSSPSALAYLHDSPEAMMTRHEIGSETSSSVMSGSTVRPFSAVSSKGSFRRRPAPLNLAGATGGVGADEELSAHQLEHGLNSGISLVSDDASSISTEFQDLSLLRSTVKQNLMERPIRSPGLSEGSSAVESPWIDHARGPEDVVTIAQVLQLLPLYQVLILDTRPLGAFLENHLPRSANISIPTLIFKRFKKSVGTKPTWDTLGGFISTTAGRSVWESIRHDQAVHIIVVGSGPVESDEMARVLQRVMGDIISTGTVRILQGGWNSVEQNQEAKMILVQGEMSTSSRPRLHNRPSLPALRSGIAAKRALPSLAINAEGPKRPPRLAINLDPPRSATVGSFPVLPKSPAIRKPPGLSLSVPKTSQSQSQPSPQSFQTLCHSQSKMPPSPSSFRVTRPEAPKTAALPSARNGLNPFIVSTILPNFLYLGPEITSEEEVQELQKLGVKRILNVAMECEDEELRLKQRFKYLKLPMRDIVEESGVAKGISDSNEFLDDARLHSSPTYVHCKAGKSRSVTVVLAYLIHANAWTLKTSYAYVAERRKGISPNIGFVAELMQFEESELGVKQSGGVLGGAGGGSGKDKEKRAQGRHMRESLPPAWSSLDAMPAKPVALHGDGEITPTKDDKDEGKATAGDEREVRKNGQWVHQRRAPVDRATLNPGRRVSKAGLESLRVMSMATMASPEADAVDPTATPKPDSRVGWI